MEKIRQRYLDDERKESIASLAASSPDISGEEAVKIYLEQCEEFEKELKEETPSSTIERLAFSVVEKRLSE